MKADPEASGDGQETAVKSEHHDRDGSESETSSDGDEDEVCHWHDLHVTPCLYFWPALLQALHAQTHNKGLHWYEGIDCGTICLC